MEVNLKELVIISDNNFILFCPVKLSRHRVGTSFY